MTDGPTGLEPRPLDPEEHTRADEATPSTELRITTTLRPFLAAFSIYRGQNDPSMATVVGTFYGERNTFKRK